MFSHEQTTTEVALPALQALMEINPEEWADKMPESTLPITILE